MSDGNAKIRFDCNRGGGEYQLAAGKLGFGPLFSTRMACPQDSLDGPFMLDLQRVTSFFVEDGQLYLLLNYDSGTMRFREEASTFIARNGRIDISGRIVFKNLEGGFNAIVDHGGRIYDPINIPVPSKDGRNVKVNAKWRKDLDGVHMVGNIIEIINVSTESGWCR
ncbi:META domain-containing protein [Desulfosarcina sp.]|uniref:META domain-containing protein n=1 Tax=Desulfosarcina sp. TaxID=2027861 RepID=UPI003563DEB1